MPQYYLMNKNDKLLEFHTEQVLGGTQVTEIHSFDKRRPIGFSDIATWVEQRNYAKHKEHFKRWLKEWNMDTTDGFLNATHALGINDCLWVKPTDSSLVWDQVNLYSNEFSDVASKTAFDSGLCGLQISSTSPEFTTEGSFPKCWEKNGSNILLYKTGATGAANVGLEPYSEYMASRISSKLVKTFEYGKSTDYDLVMYKGKLCTSCSLFTNQNTGFVPAYKLLNQNRTYTLHDILQICTDMGYEQECREMILIDSITFNQDRHLGNFGFLFDNDSFKITGFSPLFDFNFSMLCNAMLEDLKDYNHYEEEYQVGHKLGGKFSEVGKQILTPELKAALPKHLNVPMHKLYNLPLERMELLSNIFHSNYMQILGREQSFFIKKNNTEMNKEEISKE